MSAGKSSVKRRWKWLSDPRFVAPLIVLYVFVCTVILWNCGRLQFLEFHSYDFLIRHQHRVANSEPMVLVEMTDEDIHSPTLDWPIYDDKLAELLRTLEAEKPAVIGLDIWRDMPVPKNGTNIGKFNEVLQANSNIVSIFTLGGIAPPPILNSNVDRVGFNDNLITDHRVDSTNPKVRRGALWSNSKTNGDFDSLPFRMACVYLQQKGIYPVADPEDADGLLVGKAHLHPLPPNAGAYVNANIDLAQMLLDFKCPTNFTRFPFRKVLAGEIPPGMLKDKIVIVGLNSDSVFDRSVTPLNFYQLGIEMQSMITNQLLRMALNGDKTLQYWPDWLEYGWILLWCVLGGVVGLRIRSSWKLVLTIVICLAALAGIVWVSFMHGWWIPAVAPAVGFIPATALVVAYISAHERSMRNTLMHLYSRHVSKAIAESVWENRDSFLSGGRPLAQKVVVTVLFTDLKGFSTISEKMDPAHLYEWLNGYLGAMTDVVQNSGGVLKQFTGDGILVLFGVPVPHTTVAEQSQDASAAVRCALGMGQRLVEISKAWEQEGLPMVSMRAGIFTGEVAAGSIGSDDRFEYAVIGDAVNTASRLESYDKTFADPDKLPNRCRILIGAPTHALLGDKFVSKEIGLLEVKGKANKVPVFQILEERAGDEPVTAPKPSSKEKANV